MNKKNVELHFGTNKLVAKILATLKNNNGVSMIELISALLISMIIGTSVASMIIVSSEIFHNRQVLSEQHIFTDYIDMVLSDEIKYSNELKFGGDSNTLLYHTIVSDENGVTKNGVPLFSANFTDSHTVSLKFHTAPHLDGSSVESDNLYVTIYLDQDTKNAIETTINFKMLNVALKGETIPNEISATSTLSYNKTDSTT